MSIPLSRTNRLALGTATALLTLGLATGPALAEGTGSGLGAGTADDGKHPQDDKKKQLQISPASGGAGTPVTVKASCEPAGGAASEALQKPIKLKKKGDNQWAGTGKIKSSGLTPGQSYAFRVTCSDGSQQGGRFTFTESPSGGAEAGFGGSQESGGIAAALAVGGGVAAAGAAGYVFTARRRTAGQQYY